MESFVTIIACSKLKIIKIKSLRYMYIVYVTYTDIRLRKRRGDPSLM